MRTVIKTLTIPYTDVVVECEDETQIKIVEHIKWCLEDMFNEKFSYAFRGDKREQANALVMILFYTNAIELVTTFEHDGYTEFVHDEPEDNGRVVKKEYKNE